MNRPSFKTKETDMDFINVDLKEKSTNNPGILSSQVTTDNTIDQLNTQLDTVSSILKQNINQTIDNMDSITDLNNKTDNMRKSSHSFRKESKKAKKKMRCKNKRLQVIIGGIVVVGIIILII